MKVENQYKQPIIKLRQFVVEQNVFTPISAFLSLCGLVTPFTENTDTIIPFLLILSPLYINKKSYAICLALLIIALFWPHNDGNGGTYWFLNIEQNDIIMRVLLIIDIIYMLIASKQTEKFKMSTSEIQNNQFPLII